MTIIAELSRQTISVRSSAVGGGGRGDVVRRSTSLSKVTVSMTVNKKTAFCDCIVPFIPRSASILMLLCER